MLDLSFMRPEVWHALAVHFPIAILPLCTLGMVLAFFLKEERRIRWQQTAAVLLFLGTLTAWVSVFTGDNADGFVSRKICDPTVLKDHEIAGERVAYLYSLASLAIFFGVFKSNRFRKQVLIFGTLLMLVGFVTLVYAGHIGASLVYEQGAGVKNHHVDCNELH